MLFQMTEVLTAVLFTSCFRLRWLNSYFPARSLKKLLNASKLVCVCGGGLGGGGWGESKIYPRKEENRDESNEKTQGKFVKTEILPTKFEKQTKQQQQKETFSHFVIKHPPL